MLERDKTLVQTAAAPSPGGIDVTWGARRGRHPVNYGRLQGSSLGPWGAVWH